MALANGKTSNVMGIDTTLAQAIHVSLPAAPMVQYVIVESKAKAQAELFIKFYPSYCSNKDQLSSVQWVKEVRNFMSILLAGQPGPSLYFALLAKLTGNTVQNVKKSETFSIDELVENILHAYPLHKHQECLLAKLWNMVFKTSMHDTIKHNAKRVLEDMAGIPSSPEAVALVLYHILNEHWVTMKIQAVYAMT
ncbi:hypothetical protein FBU31_005113, partial [Coemansia sp. 'formosensis']